MVPARQLTALDPLVEKDLRRFLHQYALGHGVAEIALMPGMLSEEHFWNLVWHNPIAAQMFEQARVQSAKVLEEETLRIVRDAWKDKKISTAQVSTLKALLEHVRIIMGKRDPKTYSDRTPINMTIPIQINTTLDLGTEGSGTAEHPEIYALDATVELPEEKVKQIEMQATLENAVAVEARKREAARVRDRLKKQRKRAREKGMRE